jgi:hypothetical protein
MKIDHLDFWSQRSSLWVTICSRLNNSLTIQSSLTILINGQSRNHAICHLFVVSVLFKNKVSSLIRKARL